MRQAFNPYMPSYEYVPDGEPHVFGDRLYVYGSHDKFNGISFCLNDYVCWSAPVTDLTDWKYEGVIYRRSQDPYAKGGILDALYAPDVCQGKDGRFYLYYIVSYRGYVGIAVSDSPAGRYEFYDFVRYPDGVPLGKKGEPLQFDPGVFTDEDGKIYLYTGFGPVNYPAILLGGHKPSLHGPMGFELEEDMKTVRTGPVSIGVRGKAEGKGTEYEGHEFFEASSMRKFNGKYYFIYSSFEGHELCYAVSDKPLEGFSFGGTLVSNGDVGIGGTPRSRAKNYLGNTHGSLVEIGGTYYVFYHRQTNRHQFSRQACAEEIRFADGRFCQAEMTSCGLNGGPLLGEGEYSSHIACSLYSKKGVYWYGVLKRPRGIHPYFTQSGKDRECNPDQYIANFCDGATAAFKYFELRKLKNIFVKVRGKAEGRIEVRNRENGPVVCEIPVTAAANGIQTFGSAYSGGSGKQALYFTYRGKGRLKFYSFRLGI